MPCRCGATRRGDKRLRREECDDAAEFQDAQRGIGGPCGVHRLGERCDGGEGERRRAGHREVFRCDEDADLQEDEGEGLERNKELQLRRVGSGDVLERAESVPRGARDDRREWEGCVWHLRE